MNGTGGSNDSPAGAPTDEAWQEERMHGADAEIAKIDAQIDAQDDAQDGTRTPPSAGPAPEAPEDPDQRELTGHWVQRKPRRFLGAAVLGLALIGVLVGLELTFTVRTFEALAVLVAFTIVAVIAHTALTVSAPTTVTLTGSQVEIRSGGRTDVFDLDGPIRRIVTMGRPNRPNWRIRFETADGRQVELGPTQIDPHVMTEVLKRYRSTGPVPPQRSATD